jgi:hypothetical protein
MPAIETAKKIGGAASTANGGVGRIQRESSKMVEALGKKARRSSASKQFLAAKLAAKEGAARGKEAFQKSRAAEAAGGTTGKPGTREHLGRAMSGTLTALGEAAKAVRAATSGAGGITKPPATQNPITPPAADPPSGGNGGKQKNQDHRNRFASGTRSVLNSVLKSGAATSKRERAAKAANNAPSPGEAGPTRPRRGGGGSAPPRRKRIMGRRRSSSSSRHHEDDPSYPLNALRPGERQWTYEE